MRPTRNLYSHASAEEVLPKFKHFRVRAPDWKVCVKQTHPYTKKTKFTVNLSSQHYQLKLNQIHPYLGNKTGQPTATARLPAVCSINGSLFFGTILTEEGLNSGINYVWYSSHIYSRSWLAHGNFKYAHIYYIWNHNYKANACLLN